MTPVSPRYWTSYNDYISHSVSDKWTCGSPANITGMTWEETHISTQCSQMHPLSIKEKNGDWKQPLTISSTKKSMLTQRIPPRKVTLHD